MVVARTRPLAVGTATAAATAAARIVLVLLAGLIGVRSLRFALGRLQEILIRTGERGEVIAGATRKRVTTLTGLSSRWASSRSGPSS